MNMILKRNNKVYTQNSEIVQNIFILYGLGLNSMEYIVRPKSKRKYSNYLFNNVLLFKKQLFAVNLIPFVFQRAHFSIYLLLCWLLNHFQKTDFLQYIVQMQFCNKRQKLILNRMKKRQTPPKLQSDLRIILFPGQSHINTNQMKQQNSSKCLNEKENFIRCRSISSFIHSKKAYLQLPASNNGISTPNQKIEMSKQILKLCQQTVGKFKQKSKVSSDDKYTILSDNIHSLLLEFAQKVKQISSQQDKDKNNSKTIRLKICKAIHINKVVHKQKKLHFEQVFSLKLQWKQTNNKAQEKQNKQQQVILLPNELRQLKTQAIHQQSQIEELPNQISALNNIIGRKIAQIKQLQLRTQEKEDYLAQLQKRLKDIIIFVDKQVNKKLQAQTQQYKDSEKELFDFAFLFDRAPLDQYTHNINKIMAPYENLHLSLRQTANYQAETYTINQEGLKDCQAKFKNIYQCAITKLKDFIHSKVCKIERFVAIMKKIASNTVSKQQYLTLVNKKMAVTSVDVDRTFRKCQPFLICTNIPQQVVDNFYKLKELFVEIRSIYCQAQIFY